MNDRCFDCGCQIELHGPMGCPLHSNCSRGYPLKLRPDPLFPIKRKSFRAFRRQFHVEGGQVEICENPNRPDDIEVIYHPESVPWRMHTSVPSTANAIERLATRFEEVALSLRLLAKQEREDGC